MLKDKKSSGIFRDSRLYVCNVAIKHALFLLFSSLDNVIGNQNDFLYSLKTLVSLYFLLVTNTIRVLHCHASSVLQIITFYTEK